MKALVITSNGTLRKEIVAVGTSRISPVTILACHGGLQEVAARIAAEAPSLVILDASTSDGSDLELLEALSMQHAATAFMLLTPDQSPQMLLRAMRAGVREVLSLPLDLQAFNEALDRTAQKMMSAVKNGKVISFISCKGGSGATFIAANFGYALAARGQKKVLLIDLNQQFGDAALYVSDKKPTMTLSDICAQIHRIDSAFLESSVVSVAPNFGILAASDAATHSAEMKAEHIDAILRLARNHYDFIILDVGRQIGEATIHALDQSDVIYPVLQLAMPYIRDAGRLLEIFQSLGYPNSKARLIVNRYEKSTELRLSDVRSALGGAEVNTVPNNYKAVSESINQGVPVLLLARNSPVAKSLAAFADKIIDYRAVKDGGILSRLFNNRVQASVSNG